MPESAWNRRGFLKVLGGSVAAGVSSRAFGQEIPFIALIFDPNDPVAGATPAKWALAQLTQAFIRARIQVQLGDIQQQGSARVIRIIVAGAQNPAIAPMTKVPSWPRLMRPLRSVSVSPRLTKMNGVLLRIAPAKIASGTPQ